jgi:hypothetical protein
LFKASLVIKTRDWYHGVVGKYFSTLSDARNVTEGDIEFMNKNTL